MCNNLCVFISMREFLYVVNVFIPVMLLTTFSSSIDSPFPLE